MPSLCGYIQRRPDAPRADAALSRMKGATAPGRHDVEAEWVSDDGRIALMSRQFGSVSPIVAGEPRVAVDGYVLGHGADDAAALQTVWRAAASTGLADVEGDFNAAIVDGNVLHLVSSRLGARHLYYAVTEGFFAFATHVEAIVALEGVEPRVDELAMMEMFNFGYPGDDRSLIEGVRLLPPATCLTVEGASVTASRYWTLRFDNEGPAHFDNLVDEAIAAYRESLDAHLSRFAHVTVPLSGGLDSRTILALASQRRDAIPVHHCSWYAGEVRIARQLSDLCGAVWHEHDPLQFDYATILRDGHRLAQGNVLCHQFWFLPLIQRAVSAGPVEVVLDGYLMDVLFGDTFLVLPARRGVDRDESRSIVNGIWRRCRPDLVRRTFRTDFYTRYEEANRASIDGQLDAIDEPVISNRIQAFSFRNRSNRYSVALPNVQRQYVDYGYPGTTRRLMDLYARIPPSMKAGARFARTVLARAHPGAAAVDWAKTGRPVTRDKGALDRLLERVPVRQAAAMALLRGTGGRIDWSHRADLNRHFRRHRPFRRAHLDILEDERTYGRGLIDRDGLERLVALVDRGWPALFLLQALTTVELFHRQFIDGDR